MQMCCMSYIRSSSPSRDIFLINLRQEILTVVSRSNHKGSFFIQIRFSPMQIFNWNTSYKMQSRHKLSCRERAQQDATNPRERSADRVSIVWSHLFFFCFSSEAGVLSIESIRKSFTHIQISLSSKKHTIKQVGNRQIVCKYNMVCADIQAVPLRPINILPSTH